MNDVGLSILEGVSVGNTRYKDPSKRNIGLLMQSVRGVPYTPTKVSSLEDFNIILGGQNSAFLGPAIVKNLFDEAGGATVNLYLARALGSDSVTASKAGTLGAVAVTAKAGYKGSDDPGKWGNDITMELYSYGFKSKDSFFLRILLAGSQVETFTASTLASLQQSVNKVSKYITVTFAAELPVAYTTLTGTISGTVTSNVLTGIGSLFTTEVAVGDVIYLDGKVVGTVEKISSALSLQLTSRSQVTFTNSAIVQVRDDKSVTLALESGSDGTIAESDFYPGGTTAVPTGVACFNGFDVQILACTEFHTLSLAKVLNSYLTDTKGPLGLVNLPVTADEGVAELYASELQTNGYSFTSGILGWVKVPDASGNLLLIPALGAWLGAGFLRTPYLNGDFVHIPPAGTDSLFTTVVDVVPQRLSQPVINRIVQNFTCNVIQHIENTGFYIGTSRTYSTNDLYMSSHIRLQTSYYKKVVATMLKYIEQKPNSPELKRQALVDLRTFFKTEYDNGALERSIPFDNAYQGICDKSNNPTTQNRKLINIDVLWIPTECTESASISLRRNDGILTVTE